MIKTALFEAQGGGTEDSGKSERLSLIIRPRGFGWEEIIKHLTLTAKYNDKFTYVTAADAR